MLHLIRGMALFCALVGCAMAQQDRAAITGTVRDEQGRAIPGARVEVRQDGTGLVRISRASDAGVFHIGGLPVGAYDFALSQEAFREFRLTGVPLAVGQTRTVDVTLTIASRPQEVSVTAQLDDLNRESSAVGTLFEQGQIRALPLNGRNWAALLPQVTGAVDTGSSDQRSVRFAGHGRDDNSFTYDGVDAGGISNQPQKTQIRLAIPTSSIAEFKADAALFPVDAGTGTGAQIVVASAAGANQYRGDLFEFFRNDVMDARNPFAAGKQPFRLNQFGTDFSGPLAKDRAFFFAAFEALRQRLD